MKIRRGGMDTARGYRFELSGGHAVLDFANTLDLRAEAQPRDLLTDYERLLAWSQQSGVLARREVSRLYAEAERHPAAARAALRRALEVREALFDIFHASASGRTIGVPALRRLQKLQQEVMAKRTLVEGRNGVSWQWREELDLARMLWILVLDASDLLTSPRLQRVRVCEGVPCEWLFLDHSRKGNRRWCDMSVCGNRAKARRFYERTRTERQT